MSFRSFKGQRFKNFCKPLGINESTCSDIEKNYMDLLAEMTTHLEQYPYFLGNVPTIGDFSIHGMIYAHLIRDARTGFITKSSSPFVNNWCERMRGYAKGKKQFDKVYDLKKNFVYIKNILFLTCGKLMTKESLFEIVPQRILWKMMKFQKP